MEEDGWTISPRTMQRLFDETDGTAPVFRTVDGSNAPDVDTSSLAARRRGYSMLLEKALIRVEVDVEKEVPQAADFEIVAVDDPHGYATPKRLSLYRRPLPISNVAYITAAGWDGRGPMMTPDKGASTLTAVANAAAIHHQGAKPLDGTPFSLTAAQSKAMVDLMQNMFFAQESDEVAGKLATGASTARQLSAETFFFGINDPLGQNPKGDPFSPDVMTMYRAWPQTSARPGDAAADKRAAIARGQELFNRKPIRITGVKGLNDLPGLATVDGHCTTCHDSPNIGNHSLPMGLDLGLSDESRRTADLPLYTVREKATGAVARTTDPGRALATGKFADLNKMKGPILRGVAARPPYFHNGSVGTLREVAAFYDQRFGIGFTPAELEDLVAFLGTL